jgi:hypothetical protein
MALIIDIIQALREKIKIELVIFIIKQISLADKDDKYSLNSFINLKFILSSVNFIAAPPPLLRALAKRASEGGPPRRGAKQGEGGVRLNYLSGLLSRLLCFQL